MLRAPATVPATETLLPLSGSQPDPCQNPEGCPILSQHPVSHPRQRIQEGRGPAYLLHGWIPSPGAVPSTGQALHGLLGKWHIHQASAPQHGHSSGGLMAHEPGSQNWWQCKAPGHPSVAMAQACCLVRWLREGGDWSGDTLTQIMWASAEMRWSGWLCGSEAPAYQPWCPGLCGALCQRHMSSQASSSAPTACSCSGRTGW